MINLIGTALRERHGNIAVAQVEFLQRILRQKDRNRNRSLLVTSSGTHIYVHSADRDFWSPFYIQYSLWNQ